MGCSPRVMGEGRLVSMGVACDEASREVAVRDSEMLGKTERGFEHGR